ncbi:nuclear transport factor 2 family protein [Flavobacterium sp.]|uniref:nuclear transport factor 2 family protein n=1 Tax=Flavobacterium sp. TaxID=239 RepID=UPI002B6BCD0F|nr:nuclear transport factor 2 family protein [Flavobacterium sp.]HSD05860.1 nuclear transport factor 2 family protein [Flavobacterium sp.]
MTHTIKNISDFFASYKKAAWEKDCDTMITLYDDKVLIFDMWDKGFCSGLEEWSSVITSWLTSLKEEKVNVTFDKIEIQEDGNIAFASALIQFQAISGDNSVLRSMKNRITLGFVKKENGWKVKHQHTSAPIDYNLKAILDL